MCANLVASPKQIGKRPLASGSSVPVCPAFSARKRRLTCCKAALDDRPTALSSSRTPSTRRRGGDAVPGARMSVRVLAVFGDGVVDQLGQTKTGFNGIVVHEMELRHRIEREPVRELSAQVSSRMLQGCNRGRRLLLAGQMREKNLGVRKVGGHFDRGDSDHADPRVLDVQLQQIAKLALDLIADPLRTL